VATDGALRKTRRNVGHDETHDALATRLVIKDSDASLRGARDAIRTAAARRELVAQRMVWVD